eukprot:scaffold142798_cov127-Phaeocystis_antarctica.AAC.1
MMRHHCCLAMCACRPPRAGHPQLARGGPQARLNNAATPCTMPVPRIARPNTTCPCAGRDAFRRTRTTRGAHKPAKQSGF